MIERNEIEVTWTEKERHISDVHTPVTHLRHNEMD